MNLTFDPIISTRWAYKLGRECLSSFLFQPSPLEMAEACEMYKTLLVYIPEPMTIFILSYQDKGQGCLLIWTCSNCFSQLRSKARRKSFVSRCSGGAYAAAGRVLWTDGGWYRLTDLILCPAHSLDCVLCSPQLEPSSITPRTQATPQARIGPTNQNGILGRKNFINQLNFVWGDETADCTTDWLAVGREWEPSGQDFQGTVGKLWRLEQYGLVWY